MRLLRLLRLMVGLMVMASLMAGPAAAATAMAARIMPCHEPALPAVAADPGDHAGHSMHSAEAAPVMAGQGGTLLHPPAPDAVRLHMCCVLSQLIAPPLAVPGLTLPAPRLLALSPPDTAPLPGLAWPAPVPPPRLV
ncbi:conserved hypothetical protein [Ancylobacter novellus DSM 506]|uniref:DUF2946 domain-containing protein n=1 Tax=Ancylobacter novellus (strain ATCC 8093 / DSM 506 / JCM 20403 / CCM 1077 / IAM 12100 / NBRC 12443 / NCIMB 10456) TaxID=639283 RepID=D7A4M2_ANCN5|nr:hypothetical protein [Ancylobacter novellus]ADH89885.1 conserved hypothetical protein [Ancylobacter novellus DSM 506]